MTGDDESEAATGDAARIGHLVLPEGANLLHIGPQKTGSTALQAALHHRRDQLREYGVCYPGPSEKPVRAVSAGLGMGMRRSTFKPKATAWRNLLSQIDDAHALRVCVSHEGFGRMTGEYPRRVVDSLGGDRPHVLAVARRLDGLMPSHWQQRIKAGKRWSYLDWLGIVLSPDADSTASRNVWVGHDTVTLVERWAAVVGLDNVTVVASEPDNRRQLLTTVEAMLGLPAELLKQVEHQSKRSLSYDEVELIRLVNVAFERIPNRTDQDWHDFLGLGVVASVMKRRQAPSAPGTDFPPLPSWAHERLHDLSEQRIHGLTGLGVRIIGDLEWLRVPQPERSSDAEGGYDAPTVSTETAVAAIEGVLRRAISGRGARE